MLSNKFESISLVSAISDSNSSGVASSRPIEFKRALNMFSMSRGKHSFATQIDSYPIPDASSSEKIFPLLNAHSISPLVEDTAEDFVASILFFVSFRPKVKVANLGIRAFKFVVSTVPFLKNREDKFPLSASLPDSSIVSSLTKKLYVKLAFTFSISGTSKTGRGRLAIDSTLMIRLPLSLEL